jgi:hypothetical protein
MANAGKDKNASQFYITTKDNLDYLDEKHTIFGQVSEGLDILMKLNDAFVNEQFQPLRNIRILHTVILDDPTPDPPGLTIPDAYVYPSIHLILSHVTSRRLINLHYMVMDIGHPSQFVINMIGWRVKKRRTLEVKTK